MRWLLGLGVTLGLLLMLGPAIPEAQQGLTRRDARGPVTVTMTLAPPATPEAPINVKVVLDTHSVDLDAIDLQQAVVLRGPGGADIAPAAVEGAKGGGHHREAVLVFPPQEPGPIRIVVKGVGGVAERVFAWDVPPVR